MSDPFLPGNPPIPLILRRSAQARRISLRISQLDGRVTLTMPKSLKEAEGLAFAREKESWIRRHLEARGADVAIGIGAQFPLGGKMVRIEPGQGRRIQLGKETVLVPGREDRVPARYAVAVGIVYRRWRVDVFVAFDPDTTRSARLCSGARGRAFGADEPLSRILGRG